ncbi:hypothetical protein KCU93_g1175, partial [Aureobasidium melanogenum]
MAHTAEAEEAFARIEGDIAHKLKAAFVLRDRPDKTFLPVEKAKEILLEFMIHELMELCKCAGDDSIEHDQEPSSVARILAMDEQQKDYTCLVLAILLCIDKFSLVHWMQFRKYLDRSSTSLPLGSEEVYQAFGFDIGQRFYEEQFAFCPISLEEHRVNNYTRIKSRCKMPYLEEVKIGSGSFGTVYKIKIPRGHLQGTYYNTTTLARKDFEIAGRGRENFDQEWETMEHILQAKGLHDNIMRTYAGLKLDSQLSIFYPLAKCNLAEYLKNHQDFSSSICDRLLASGAESHRAKRELFIQVRDLAEALKSLHDFSSKDSTMASCFHMDLKPENILVCTDHNGSEIWKISDFGISRVEKIEDKARNVRTTLNLDKVFNRILNYSKELKQVTAPGGGGTYIAPEALYPESKVTTKCDVWSLACIVLMVMSFTHGGPEEVKSFQKKLAEHGKGSDWFFVTKDIRKFSLPFALKKTYKGQDENGEPTRVNGTVMAKKIQILDETFQTGSLEKNGMSRMVCIVPVASPGDPSKDAAATITGDKAERADATPDGRDDQTVFRKLRSIHIFMITISGILGVGLYVRSGEILGLGGPAAVLSSFAILGFIAWAVMQCIAEMLCIWPVPGALVEFVRAFVDDELGIVVGLAYWFTYSINLSALITATAIEANLFAPIPSVKAIVLFIILPGVLFAINSLGVALYGFVEIIGGVVKIAFCVIILITMIAINVGAGAEHHIGSTHLEQTVETNKNLANGWGGAFL